MTWFEDLKRVTLPDGRKLIGASFRGVTFFVQRAERTGGRRKVTHEFPKRDDPFIEDLGRKARTYPIEGYVIGDDYIDARDALTSALEDVEGPGTLVHPYYGIRRCVCDNFTISESIDDGGMANFRIQFDEAPVQAVTPTDVSDFVDLVSTSADLAFTGISDEFVRIYDVTNQPAFALESLSAELTAISDRLESELSGIVDTTQELAKLKQEIGIITAQASSLVRTPAAMLDAFKDAISNLVITAVTAPLGFVNSLVATYGEPQQDLALPSSSTRIQEALNQQAQADALRRILVIEAARLTPTATFSTIDDALFTRGTVLDLLDLQLLTAEDDSFTELQQLRADVILAVPGDAELARILTREQRSTINSLLLTYQLYGSLDLEFDVVARNNVRHPGFISGTLEVLSG